MLPLERGRNSLSKEVLHTYVWETFEFCGKNMLSQLAIGSICDTAISSRHDVDLNTIYLHTNFRSIFSSSPKLWPKRGFVKLLQFNSRPSWIGSQPKFNQFFPYMRDISCERKLIYVNRILRYVGKRQTEGQTDRKTDRQTNIQTQAKT